MSSNNIKYNTTLKAKSSVPYMAIGFGLERVKVVFLNL
jgi:hypothetical protein